MLSCNFNPWQGLVPRVAPELHWHVLWTICQPSVREVVEKADCVLCLGAVLTEMETGGYTAKLEPKNLISLTAKVQSIGYHSYERTDLCAIINELLVRVKSGQLGGKSFNVPVIEPEKFQRSENSDALSVADMIESLNSMLSDKYSVISDVGDCLYASLSLKTNIFLAPGYYSSMGFGMPAAIGAAVADPSRRPLVLVGDGGFSDDGNGNIHCRKMGLRPIVIVFNNASYAMLRFVDQPAAITN